MLDDHADNSANPESSTSAGETAPAAPKATRKRSAKKSPEKTAAKKTTAKKTTAKTTATKTTAKKSATKKTATKKAVATTDGIDGSTTADPAQGADIAEQPAKRTRKRTAATKTSGDAATDEADDAARLSAAPLFQPPEATARRSRPTKKAAPAADDAPAESATADSGGTPGEDTDGSDDTPARRKRRRGGRRRRKPSGEGAEAESEQARARGDAADEHASGSTEEPPEGESTSSRRRRRRRRSGEDAGDSADDPTNTVTKTRGGRSGADEITAVTGSTRLEAKKQRRREGREAGRRRAPIVSEAEFLARRESVNRVMVIRQRQDLTQIGVLEDNVLVEHYVARESQTSLIGNVYLGRVQNVLPSMEAAFIDIGKGRNAVLYAGEVNWSALGHKDGQPRNIESVLSSGQTVLVQVTKDPIGHKGARLTSQISLAGRFLVYVPDGTTSGISRKLPDTERNRLKTLLKDIVPEQAGVIVRTAAEGASEDELTRDVERLKARWDDIEKKAANKGAGARLLYGEPDLTLKVVRDLFTEDFTRLVVEGDDAWDLVDGYVSHVAPDLSERLERFKSENGKDVFAAYRVDEQIAKGLDRKVGLPSGGSLIIDRTEAMTVVDVNTGKFTGSGGNLEETVTKNNLEAAEEMVRQLRLRDIGGIIVVDFIDMVLESNRDLVLRRLVECLGRDRTRHQVAEVTSLGLVQMTRKRIGTGLLESFSHDCPHCHGRGVIVEDAPIEPKQAEEDEPRRARRSRGRSGSQEAEQAPRAAPPSPKDIAAIARHHEEHPDEPATEPTEEDVAEDVDVVEEDVEARAEQEAPETEASPPDHDAPDWPTEWTGAPEQDDASDDLTATEAWETTEGAETTETAESAEPREEPPGPEPEAVAQPEAAQPKDPEK